ncbi:hypothetical protein FAGAP_9021 [Fusarium agapanthi]|uniref:Uncharacterized protein n=1 Tax=Fusarium agapanthi TaxID=1803897 RepID=A0A9P5E9I3_9HYPO|nr:hypothetical protein FAGAP_9021 [Fusarium agapanthi]
MPSLLAATQRYGAFMFFPIICTISFVYVYFAMLETSGRSLESMDKLFERPWYTVHKIAYPTADDLKPAAREILEPEMKDQDSILACYTRRSKLERRARCVESLRRRVAELEGKIKIAEQKHVQARHTSFGTVDAVSPINGKRRRSNYGSISSAPVNEQTAANGEEQSSVQDTMSAIGLLSNKAMAESRTNTGDKPHKLAIIESISAALAVDGRDPSKASSSQPVYVMDDQLNPLTRDLTLSHFQPLLDWSVWLPHIDENRLFEQYEAVLETINQGADPTRTALPRFNTYLFLAIGVRWINMAPYGLHYDELLSCRLAQDCTAKEHTRYRLACRALIPMAQPREQNPTNSEVDAESDSELEADTISCCKALIEKLYSRSGSGTTVSFLDAYDILAAAVAYVCLVQRTPQPNQTGLTHMFEVVSKASILITQCSYKFSALSIFQQFLLTLSTKMMEGQGSPQVAPVRDEILERYPLTKDKTPQERAAIEKSLVRKLDWKFLPLVTAMLLMNYLD